MTVVIRPMPEKFKKFPMIYRPGFPPVFPDGNPSDEDIQLAIELFRLLDHESKEWFRHGSEFFRNI